MKKHAACERRMDHSLGPMLREYLFVVANALLTVPRAVGNLDGSPMLVQLETMEEVKGSCSTHWKGFHNDIDTWEDWRAS